MCVRLLTEEIKSFVPALVDENEADIDIPELKWMTTYPDQVEPWPVWVSRFLYNVLVYDAPAVYKMRDEKPKSYIHITKGEGLSKEIHRQTELDSLTGELIWYCDNCGNGNKFKMAKVNLEDELEYPDSCGECGTPAPDHAMQKMNKFIAGYEDGLGDLEKGFGHFPVNGLRVIDGSTIFALIDERGEQPQPPAPAFTQVIWGVPRMYMNTHQLWYRPRHLRADAPYGRSFIEDSLQAVMLLHSLWDYEYQKYQIGNIPELAMTIPAEWGQSADQILEFENAYNARMSGSNKERVRLRFFPAGTEVIQTKELGFNKESYDAATNTVRMSVGIPKGEAGEGQEGMLGGAGFAAAMQSSFYRMGLAPLQTFIESLFDEILKENGYTNIKFKLKFPTDSLDPEKEEAKWQGRFANGLVRRDEARTGVGMNGLGGEDGKFMNSPKGGGGEEGGGEGGAPTDPNDPNGGMGPVTGGPGPAMPDVPDIPKVPINVYRSTPGPTTPKINVSPASKFVKVMSVKKVQEDETTHVQQTGVMVALPIKLDLQSIKWPNDSEATPVSDMHLSLAVMDDIDKQIKTESDLNSLVSQFCKVHDPIQGKINGVGRFNECHIPGKAVIYASFDAPGLPEFRQELFTLLQDNGFDIKENHGFTPHVTLAYIPADVNFSLPNIPVTKMTIDQLLVAWGEKKSYFGLDGLMQAKKIEEATTLKKPEDEEPPVDPDELAIGIKEEQEHAETVGGDEATIRSIALDHLGPDPKYYTHLREAGLVEKFISFDSEMKEWMGDWINYSVPVEK